MTASRFTIAISAVIMLGASLDLDIGSISEPGPGAAPMVLSVLMLALTLCSFAEPPPEPLGGSKALISLAAMSVFALALTWGMIPAVLAMTASLAVMRELTWQQALISTVSIMTLCVTVFTVVLDLPLPLMP